MENDLGFAVEGVDVDVGRGVLIGDLPAEFEDVIRACLRETEVADIAGGRSAMEEGWWMSPMPEIGLFGRGMLVGISAPNTGTIPTTVVGDNCGM